MKNNKVILGNIIKWLLIFFICFVGYKLRIKNYSVVPRPGESLDEYANAWSGLGLIKLGVPVGWSYINSEYYRPSFRYINVDNVYQTAIAFGNPFYLHMPWLDHPPGMGLLTGGFAYIKGAKVLEDASTIFIRKPMIYVGVINIFLLFLLAYSYYNYPIAIIASSIYAVSSLIVVSSRMPQSENAFLSLFLISTIFIRLFQTKQKYSFLVLSAIFAGIGIWFKIPAIMISVSGFLMIFSSYKGKLVDRLKLSFSFGWMSLSLGLLPLLAYGLALDPKAFFQVILFHSQRNYGIGITALYNLITQSKITNSIGLTDGWVFFGWISWLILLVTNKNKNQKLLISIPMFVAIIFYIFLGSEAYGWYAFIFFPWLILSIASLFHQSKKNISILCLLSVLITIPAQILINKLELIKTIPSFVNAWRWGFALYLFMVLTTYISKNKKMSYILNALILIWLIIDLWLSIKYSLFLTPDKWFGVN